MVQAGVDLFTIIDNSNQLPVSPMVGRFRTAPRSPRSVLGRRRRSPSRHQMSVPSAGDSTDFHHCKRIRHYLYLYIHAIYGYEFILMTNN